jgi:hypothetical protein
MSDHEIPFTVTTPRLRCATRSRLDFYLANISVAYRLKGQRPIVKDHEVFGPTDLIDIVPLCSFHLLGREVEFSFLNSDCFAFPKQLAQGVSYLVVIKFCFSANCFPGSTSIINRVIDLTECHARR